MLFSAAALYLAVGVAGLAAQATYPQLPSETPAQLQAATQDFNYDKRDVMIPMRDGVRLHAVIVIPKGASNAPMLLTRTPYSATAQTSHAASSHLGPTLWGYDNPMEVIVGGGYIRVVEDVRGKYGSEGDYVMNRPPRGPLNSTPVDESTDTYDTIDWLVKNVPESNGKVGILGISYDGWTTLMALFHPHPALKVAVPMNPMVDGWMGDDWFHNGAFREQNLPYIYEQEATRSNDAHWWSDYLDDYYTYMNSVSAGELGRHRGVEQVGFWRKILEHPAYDSWWQEQAVDKLLAKEPLTVPTMLVDSLWDQEDIYGAMAVYKAVEPKDTANDKLFLVMGPWHHGQEITDGSTLGALNFNSDTGLYFREHILRPFLDHYLKDDAPQMNVAPVTAFETGTNHWERLNAWPSGCTNGCTIQQKPLYLEAGLKAGFAAPQPGDAAFDEYVSDPAKPVPFRARPIQPVGYGDGFTWAQWLVDDQREASGRPDVAVFTSDVLTKPLKIAGEPIVHLVASTSGTDSDWVVKLIDVYPDEVASEPRMGGYQLMISADIFRGRYRESLETPKPLAANQPLLYRWALPNANHVFLPGHRIMVQVQSSWFPLYDRNPQTFVPNIFWAKPADYRKATQRVYHSPGQETFIELPVVTH
jgi:putative CocE/NonD family hydrolase